MHYQNNLEKITAAVVETCKEVCVFLLEHFEHISSEDVEYKGVHNLVTFVDKEAERKIIAQLKEIVPEAGFIAEESLAKGDGKSLQWVIDPIDGTTNFIHSIPFFCISIALVKDGNPLLGVIYEPVRKEAFYAWKDGGAFLNEKPIKVTKSPELNQSVLATGFPYADYTYIKAYLSIFEYMMKNTRGVRRLGSAALDMAYTACGRVDGFYEYGLSPWDVAAGCIIVSEAGGKVTDFRGGTNYLFGQEMIATNSLLHNELLELFQEKFLNQI